MAQHHPAERHRAGGVRRPARAHGVRLQQGAARLRADPGQAVPRRLRPAARRGDARPHRRRSSARWPTSALQAAGRRERRAVPRPLDQRLRQRAERRHRVLHAQAVRRAARQGRVRPEHRRRAQRQVRRHSGRLRRRVPAPAGQRAGARSAASSWSSRIARARRDGAERRHPGAARARPIRRRQLAGLFSELPDQRAAARGRGRPGEGEAGGHLAHRPVPDHADLPRVGLRQRLQPVRPHLPGHGAGRRAVSAPPPRTSRSSRCGTRRARWCRSARWSRSRSRTGPTRGCATTATPRPTSTAAPRPASARARRRRPSSAIAARRPAERHRLRVDRPQLPAAAVRQHRDLRLPALRAAGLPGAGGAVRELVAAARGHPDRADVAALRHHRRVAHARATTTSSPRSGSWCSSVSPARTRS